MMPAKTLNGSFSGDGLDAGAALDELVAAHTGRG